MIDPFVKLKCLPKWKNQFRTAFERLPWNIFGWTSKHDGRWQKEKKNSLYQMCQARLALPSSELSALISIPTLLRDLQTEVPSSLSRAHFWMTTLRAKIRGKVFPIFAHWNTQSIQFLHNPPFIEFSSFHWLIVKTSSRTWHHLFLWLQHLEPTVPQVSSPGSC